MRLAPEPDLVNQYLQQRTPELREKMILGSVELVRYVLSRLGLNRDLRSDYDDLLNQGLIGLMEAVDRFDPARGAQFSTYAILVVRGKVLDYLRTLDWFTYTTRKRVRQVSQSIPRLTNRLGRAPTDEEIAAELDMALALVQRALVDASQVITSLDAELDSDAEGELSLYDRLADENQADPSDILLEQDQAVWLVEALKRLPEREQLVLSLYYQEGLTFKEIGGVLNITESRACQLHARAVLLLRGWMEESSQPQPEPDASARPASAPARTNNRMGQRVRYA